MHAQAGPQTLNTNNTSVTMSSHHIHVVFHLVSLCLRTHSLVLVPLMCRADVQVVYTQMPSYMAIAYI
jgi:hypothetical protein